jgi:CheY-like chemotaxis protein
VEDDVDIRDAIVELLSEDYDVSTAKDGAVALKMLREGHAPDLILLDLMMPIMDGFTFREEQLRDPKLNGIPVIVMSADGNVIDKQARAKAIAYLKKPLDIQDFLGTLEKHLK